MIPDPRIGITKAIARGRCLLLLAFLAVSCGRAPARPIQQDSTRPGDAVPPPLPPTSAPTPARSAPTSNSRELVEPADLPPSIRVTCDSAMSLMRQALLLEVKREDGDYFDSFKGAQRLGCRLTAEGSFTALKDSAGPADALEKAFARQGWKGDLRYMADGPDGQDLGFRRLDLLCILLGRWNGADDGDRYQAIVECARDVPSNTDAGVPDSIWRIASAAGLDSLYAISLRLQYPPYLDGDFDGDGVSDAAVLVERRSTGKSGVAIVHRGTHRVSILAAGSAGAGPDDLSWIDRWDVFRKGTTMNLTIGDRPSVQLSADALWVGRQDSLSAFYVWTGANYVWESHRRP